MIQKTNEYFKFLLFHLNNIQSLNCKSRNEYWINYYLSIIKNIESKSIDNLPSIMPLIYPVFLISGNGDDLGDLVNFNASNFNSGINLSDNCQFQLIQESGYCEFNQYRQIREKCQADHYWPHSLGGPTIIENRILLCKFHNVAKSNSIMIEFWKTYPTWLNDYLKRIYNLKK